MTIRSAIILFCLLLAGDAAAQAEDAATLTRRHLEQGTLAAGEAALLQADQADPNAQFGLGVIRFAQAVERLGRGFHRHGHAPAYETFIPFLRLPVPENPNPQPLSYEDFRAILQTFLDDLARAEASLAETTRPEAKIGFDLNRVQFDLDADGRLTEAERLDRILNRLLLGDFAFSRERPPLPVSFDHSDSIWLRGYCRLLAAFGEFWLAHDWRETFDASFHLFFPRSTSSVTQRLTLPQFKEKSPRRNNFGDNPALFADVAAMVYTIRWPVAEPERLRRVRTHLKAVTALSRENWRAILAETDDDQEWIPSPSQKDGVFRGLSVSQERVDAWLQALDDFDAVLDGRKFIPHWRFAQGVDLRKVLEEPRPFDLGFWAAGHAATPYLADGEKVGRQSWELWSRVFGGNFLLYAFWFN